MDAVFPHLGEQGAGVKTQADHGPLLPLDAPSGLAEHLEDVALFPIGQDFDVIRFQAADFADSLEPRVNGPDFDLASADKLFIAFQRLPGPNVEGYGIGLAVVEMIVIRHGGRE